MGDSEIKITLLSVVSVGVGIVALVSPEYRLLLVSIFSLFLAAYFLSAIYGRVEGNSERIKKLEERLSIHQQLVDLKADVAILKNKVFKK